MVNNGYVLIVEPVAAVRAVYRVILGEAGYSVCEAASASEAEQVFDSASGRPTPSVALIAFSSDGLEAWELQRRLRVLAPRLAVVALLSAEESGRAISALRGGAVNFLVKPFEEQVLLSTTRAAFDPAAFSEAAAQVEAAPLGVSPAMVEVAQAARRISPGLEPVLLTGEAAVGKRICATLIHDLSPVATGPFQIVDCAAPTDAALSLGVLAPGDAAPDEFRRADRGTAYFSNAAALAPELQERIARRLRGLRSQALRGVGALGGPRLIFGLRRPPGDLMEAGVLRRDLFEELAALEIRLAPLRERRSDILPLAERFLRAASAGRNRGFRGFEPEAEIELLRRDWRGNANALREAIEAAVAAHDGVLLTTAMLPPNADNAYAPNLEEAVGPLVGCTIEEVERALIEATVAAEGGSAPAAARRLGLAPSTLYRKRAIWREEPEGARPDAAEQPNGTEPSDDAPDEEPGGKPGRVLTRDS